MVARPNPRGTRSIIVCSVVAALLTRTLATGNAGVIRNSGLRVEIVYKKAPGGSAPRTVPSPPPSTPP